MRCLKRYVAAEMHKLAVNPPVVSAFDDFRVLRQLKKMRVCESWVSTSASVKAKSSVSIVLGHEMMSFPHDTGTSFLR